MFCYKIRLHVYMSLLSPCPRSLCALLTPTETNNIKGLLTTLDALLNLLQSDVAKLKSNVTAVKNRLSVTINKGNCKNCNVLSPALQQLTLDSLTVSVSASNSLGALV